MVSKRIKGLSIVLGADAEPAIKAMGELDKASSSTYRELKSVQNQLRFEPGNAELLAQKQELLAQHVETTSDKLKILREAQDDVNKRFKEGEIPAENYRQYQRDLVKTESMLKNYEAQLKKVNFESNEFRLAMEKAGNALRGAGDKMSKAGGTLTKTLTAPITAAVTALGALAVKSAQVGDRVDKLSQQIGISRQGFQEWDYILDQTGGNIESLKMGLSTLAQQAVTSAKGGATAFDSLGISVEGANGQLKSQEQLLGEVVAALQKEEDITKRNALAKQLLGRSAQELSTLLNSEAGTLEELTDRAHELGLVLEDDTIDATVRFNDMMTDLKRTLTTATTEIGAALAPTFETLAELVATKVAPTIRSLADRVNGLVVWYKELSPAIQNVIKGALAFAVAIGPVIAVVGKLTTGIGAVVTAFGTMVAFIKTSLIPAIMAINWPVVGVVAAIAGLAVVAYEVYRAWDEVKGALTATWEYLKAQAENLGIAISIAMEKMKHATLSAVDAIIEKLSVLEKLPWGLGDGFADLASNVGDSVDKSKAKILELEAASKQNSERIRMATDNMKLAWGDVGQKIADDIALLISKIKGSGDVTEEEMQTITTTVKKNLDAQYDLYEEHYEEVEELVDEHVEKRADFEEQWNRKLFDLTADRRAKLKKEYEDAIALAEEYGADRLAIEEWYQESLALLEQEEQERKESFAAKWDQKLFEQSANKIDLLQREYHQALKDAEDNEEAKAKITIYYEREIAKERQKQIDEILDAEEKAREKREQEQEKQRQANEAFEKEWNKKLFELTADRIDILQREKQEQIALAMEQGHDWLKVDEYYNALIAEERQKLADERLKIAEDEAKKAADLEEKTREDRLAIEKQWSDKRFDQVADPIDKLQREYHEELKLAEEKGADTADIIAYYEEEITKERQRQADERARIAETEAQKELEETQKRLDFEKSWSDKLFDLTATPEMQIERLEQEAKDMQELAEKMEASAETIYAIQEYYAQRQVEIQEQIANENLTLWDRMAQAMEDPLESLQSKIIDAGSHLAQFTQTLAAGDFKSAFLSVLAESETFQKALEILAKAMKPVVTLFDKVFRPVIEFIVGVWNAIMRGLSSISIFGWKPFGGLKDNIIEFDDDKGKGGSTGGGRGGGAQYAQFSGPDRDFLTDKLSGLSALPQIIAPIHDIRNMLANYLPNLATAGAGSAIVFEPGSIVIDGGMSEDSIGRTVARQIDDAIRRRGGRW